MTNTAAASDSGPTDSAAVAIKAWFGERLPSEWTATPPQVTVDREEIIVILGVPSPESADAPAAEPGSPEAASAASSGDAAAAATAQARAGRIARFREETRDRRIAI